MSGDARFLDNLLHFSSATRAWGSRWGRARRAAPWAIVLPLAGCASIGKVQVADYRPASGFPSEVVVGAECVDIAPSIDLTAAAASHETRTGSLELSCATRPRQVDFAHVGSHAEARVDSIRWPMLSEARLTVYDASGAVRGWVWAGVGHRRTLSDATRLSLARKLGEAISARLNAVEHSQ